jgi:hypothetical protein
MMVLLLQPNAVADQVRDRYHIVAQLLSHNGFPCRVLGGQKGPPLGQVLGMLLGD